MSKPLVVIIDEEADQLTAKRWFLRGSSSDHGKWLVETPMGKQRVVEGTLIEDHRIGQSSEEYLYMETTPSCQFSCAHCGIEGERISTGIDEVCADTEYVTEEFAEKLAATFTQSGRVFPRGVFYGGGEPLINHSAFGRIHSIFKKQPRTTTVVITNGFSIPITPELFEQFMAKTNIGPFDNIYISSTEGHSRHYELAAKKKNHQDYIPDVEPANALGAKIVWVKELCKQHRIGFKPIVIGSHNGDDLRQYILETAHKDVAHELVNDMNVLELNGNRQPCSQAQETSIRANGDLHPHCYDIFSGNYKLGVAGLLLD